MAKIKKEDLIASLKEMSLLEINELIEAIETEFGVTASAPTMAAAAVVDEAPSEVTVTLKSFGANKVPVIKIVRELTGLGLMDAKKKVESAPTPIKESIKPEEAEEIATKLKDAGAEVEIK